jgi:hypothetical protein
MARVVSTLNGWLEVQVLIAHFLKVIGDVRKVKYFRPQEKGYVTSLSKNLKVLG